MFALLFLASWDKTIPALSFIYSLFCILYTNILIITPVSLILDILFLNWANINPRSINIYPYILWLYKKMSVLFCFVVFFAPIISSLPIKGSKLSVRRSFAFVVGVPQYIIIVEQPARFRSNAKIFVIFEESINIYISPK